LLNFATAAATGVFGFASAAQQAAAATEVVTNSLDQINPRQGLLSRSQRPFIRSHDAIDRSFPESHPSLIYGTSNC
jgi:hypothetical protein